MGIEKAPAEIPPPPPVEPAPPEPAPCAPDPTLQPAPEPTQILVQRSLKAEPEPATYIDLAGIVSALCPATGQLLISADDTRASESDLLLTVPASIKTTKLKVGDSLVATATVEEDGTLTLAGLASDEGRKGASSTSQAQGDLEALTKPPITTPQLKRAKSPLRCSLRFSRRPWISESTITRAAKKAITPKQKKVTVLSVTGPASPTPSLASAIGAATSIKAQIESRAAAVRFTVPESSADPGVVAARRFRKFGVWLRHL